MIPHNRPTLGEDELRAAGDALASGWVARGPQAHALEEELCEYLNLNEGCAALVSSGTAALFLGIRLIDPRPATVAIPAYACAALSNAAAMAQSNVAFIDTDAGSPNPGARQIDSCDAVLAILPNMYGIPANAQGLKTQFIDDAAQSMGARYGKEFVGTRGIAGILSFYATKLITTGGGGGAIVARDRRFIDLVRDYLDFDCRGDSVRRFNFQMTDVQAAIGRVQLKRLDGFIARRAEIFASYAAAGLPLLGKSVAAGAFPVRYRAVLRASNPKKMIARLARENVTAIVPTADFELPPGDFPNARALCNSTVSLPIYPSLSDAEVEHICHAVQGAA